MSTVRTRRSLSYASWTVPPFVLLFQTRPFAGEHCCRSQFTEPPNSQIKSDAAVRPSFVVTSV